MSSDEIVVSGIAGRFPSSKNVAEFGENLFNKVDMADDDESRWKHFHPKVPKRMGKIRNLEKFDSAFFSILDKHANQMDPQGRILLEHSYEAIVDAGISPQSLVGSKTGVFIGCSLTDAQDAFTYQVPSKTNDAYVGNYNFYLSNRISYALGLTGPSFTLDSACSSSAYALDCAFRYLQSGVCDAAIVGGAQLTLNLSSTVDYTKAGVLAEDGVCRPFDQFASGFARADTVCVIFLQRLKDSKRVYAKLLYTNTNNDGFKKEGSTFPSKIMQQKLMEDFFAQSKIDPNCVNFVEAHSTGTKVGDPEEVAAIDAVFCKNGQRDKPLPVGSVKSNIGHAESSSAVASIAKIILALENQKIPPNIHITRTKEGVPAFDEGRLRVVTEVEDLSGPFISMNSFGLGGANCHALFKGNLKTKVNGGLPKDDLDRLLLWSGRTEDAVKAIFNDITKRPLDSEYIALLQNSQVQTNSANVYRGYGVFAQDKETGKATCVRQNTQLFTSERRKIVWVYTGIGSQWVEMGKDLMVIPIFRESIQKCHDILLPKGLNLIDIITAPNAKTFDEVLNSYVGIIAIEIALTDVLRSLGLSPDFIIGHSVGEVGCAYADGCFTAEETILAAYSRGVASVETKVVAGSMAAIGMNHKEVEKILPPEIDIACHNSVDSTTISGPEEVVKIFVADMKKKEIFAKEVACSGIPLHSRYIKEMGSNLLEKLNKVIKTPKKRSEKWLSSTCPEDQWNTTESQYSSGQYHTKNLLSPVLFEEVLAKLPENSLTIEIAPHGLLKSILKRSIKEGVHLSLTQRDNKAGTLFLMEALGTLFQNGIDIDIAQLYPPVSFPVSRGTPMISPIIKWDHRQNFFVPYFDSCNFYERRNLSINLSDKSYDFVKGHVIDGKVLFPGTGYLFLVWETLALMLGVPQMKLKVAFEEVKFMRATSMQKDQDISLTIVINRASGHFEITEGKTALAQGTIKALETAEMSDVSAPEVENPNFMQDADFYKEMRLRGYHHQGLFRAVTEIRDDGLKGKIKWNDNWTTFTDCLIQFFVVMKDSRMLILPTSLRKMIIDPELHHQMLTEIEGEEKLLKVENCPYQRIIRCGGVEIHDFGGSSVNRRRQQAEPVLEAHKFISHHPSQILSKIDMAKVCVQLALENEPVKEIVSVEVDGDDEKPPLSENIFESLGDLPIITSKIKYLTKRNIEIDNVAVEDRELSQESQVNLVIRSSCVGDKEFLKTAKSVLNGKGFILSREDKNLSPPPLPVDLQRLATIQTENENILVLRFVKEAYETPQSIIKITSNVEDWLEPLQKAIKVGKTLAYSQHNPLSGILGLINCIKKEPNGDRLQCVLIEDETAPEFDIKNSFYSQELSLGLVTNVYKDGAWGSYQHLRIEEVAVEEPRSNHHIANCHIKGDLSTLSWFDGPLNAENLTQPNIRIQYASMNFRDVMVATGKINMDDLFSRTQQQCIMGFEFSGVDQNGQRVMGLASRGALATHIDLSEACVWNVPDHLSLEEAATLPMVYCTVFLAFFVESKIKKGDSVLIHAGTGGVGIAAIHVALAYGLEVFTTVGSEEKKKFLLETFPQLNVLNIGNSRDTTFEKMIQVRTKGKGVDFVLNSLADDKLQASLRCLALNGTFLEIGKYDIMNKTKIHMGHFEKRISFRAVFLELRHFTSADSMAVSRLFEEGVKSGIVKPLKTNVFEAKEVEKAFRFMASGKHMGKVLLKIRENEFDPKSLPVVSKSRVHCSSQESYVIVGGLGGFGLELADWLVLRGCRKFVLSSSRNVTNAYQASRLKIWRSYGVEIVICTADVGTKSGCEELINEAIKLGAVGGIFNLAVALRDGIFENQDVKMFNESFAPKADATKHLDEISQKICKNLKHFVVFSSVSCGRGNAGQSNYGMANSIMEKIVQRRAKLGLPAKAIQWGAVGEVGLLAALQEKNMEMTIGGTLPQSITNCLEVLDTLLNVDETVVSSMIVAEKKFDDVKKGNILDTIFNIMSIRDRKAIPMDTTLSRLGMDSLMGVEIQQVLERDYDIALSPQEMRTLTLSQLEKRVHMKEPQGSEDKKVFEGIALLLSSFGDEATSDQTILKLESKVKQGGTKVLIIPGLEAMAGDVWHGIAKELNHLAFILQLGNATEANSLEEIFNAVSKDVLDLFSDSPDFILFGYSFGSMLTLKLASFLENNGKTGSVTIIDGSPAFLHKLADTTIEDKSEENIQSMIILPCIRLLFPNEFEDIAKKVLAQKSWDSRLETFIDIGAKRSQYTAEYGTKMINAIVKRVKMCLKANEIEFGKVENSSILLIKPTNSSLGQIDEDYELGQHFKQEIKIKVIEGDHASILRNPELLTILNN